MRIGVLFTFFGRNRLKAVVVFVILALLVFGVSLSSRFQATEESLFIDGGNLLVHIDDEGLPGLGRLKLVGDCREVGASGTEARTIDTVTQGGSVLCQLTRDRNAPRDFFEIREVTYTSYRQNKVFYLSLSENKNSLSPLKLGSDGGIYTAKISADGSTEVKISHGKNITVNP